MLTHGWTVSAALVVLAGQALAQQDSVFSKASNETLLWGPYKPNLYFGVRPRLPKSVSLGMLWARTDNFDHISPNVRWTCEQHEGMAGYGWDAYDSRKGGIQTIRDKGNDIDIETSFVKVDGGAWAARIKGKPTISEADSVRTSVWFTVSVEGLGSLDIKDAEAGEELGFEGDVVVSGSTPDLGDFSIQFTEAASNQHPRHAHPTYDEKPLDRTLVHSANVPEEAIWQSKPIVFRSIKETFDGYLEQYGEDKMPPPYQVWTIRNQPGQGNVHIIEKIFQGAFEFDIIQKPDSHAKAIDVSKEITDMRKTFDSLYGQIFKPQAPFTDSKYVEFSKSLFSNLIGGIGYFYGDQVIDRSYATEYEEVNEGFWQEAEEARNRNEQKLEGPYELFTSVPSRPFFPRGFLWDEGFHLLPILEWDMELTMQIVSSWFNTMDEDGWIAREQILGAEARTKVPQEFQTQYPHYANPPTLFMVVEALLDKISDPKHLSTTVGDSFAQAEGFKSWLQALYPRLQKNYDWYRRTQLGDVKSYDRKAFSTKEAYRWRGRTPRHILTSGLDDYPRAQPPHPGELHLDLISWMGMTARALHRIAVYLGNDEDASRYGKIEEAISRNIDDLHWDSSEKTYCDATIDDYEESIHVCHKGYVSIFPFMTGLIGPDHKNLKHILNLIADEDELWSPFGIRSLSRSEEAYGTDENYWRSPIWMNMNYLIIKNLYSIATQSGPQQKRATSMYSGLRQNLVNAVYSSWKETGFAWEQYNPETGAGQRTQHFTGWTSLVVKILAMPDLKDDGRDEL
ncbi:hypothetical protein AMS68_008020 [Peltaster fructicola]|uniref:Mannosyl-oligosaccharide glucosidase n=1 Tax=Peltaster fructicola TaxID=286661 RepID=A0A6H0Y671_9PEZI|nr:hypothetical protein AMS68_008020 [Peltaster fructicola]